MVILTPIGQLRPRDHHKQYSTDGYTKSQLFLLCCSSTNWLNFAIAVTYSNSVFCALMEKV